MNKEIKEFKISCHAIGKIMAGEVGLTDNQHTKLKEYQLRLELGGKPLTDNMVKEYATLIHKRDNPELSKGAKTYCKEWLKKKMFNRKPEWKAVVIEKGLQVEPMAILLMSKIFGVDLVKNEDFFDNEYIQGSPDIIQVLAEIVRDVKSSWDLFTFPMFDDEVPDQDYWWQLQGYMILLGFKKAALDYVLIDTPMPLVLQDLKKLYYQSGGTSEEWTPDKYETMYPNYRFDDVPEEMRIKTFEFELQDWTEAAICERVVLCRKYIKTLLDGKS